MKNEVAQNLVGTLDHPIGVHFHQFNLVQVLGSGLEIVGLDAKRGGYLGGQLGIALVQHPEEVN